jgi:hypothetical protein
LLGLTVNSDDDDEPDADAPEAEGLPPPSSAPLPPVRLGEYSLAVSSRVMNWCGYMTRATNGK